MYCFPDLFPYGIGGRREEREEQAQPLRYEKTRLMSSNPQFRRNFSYLFFLLQEHEKRKINQGMFASVNNIHGLNDISTENLLRMLKSNDQTINRHVTRVLSKVPNTPQYWAGHRVRLEAQIEKFGPPSVFVTFSPAEYDWVEAYEYVKQHNLDLPNIATLLPTQLFAIDPVLTSTFIRHKFDALLEFIKLSNVLGSIKSYWARDEYQGRGTYHFHCFFWIKDAPVLGKSTDNEVAEFVNSLITCRLPDKEKEPTLYSNVMKYQLHNCGKYCKRIIENKSNGKFTSSCRFSFPRKPSNEFVLHDVVSSIVGRHTNNFKKRLYDLPRNSSERCINDYNPDLLLLWGGNMDIQFISENTYSICNYVTKYVTKSEKSNIDNLEFIDESQNPYQKATKFAYSLLRTRELGGHEAADRTLHNGGELWRSSESFFFVPTTFPKYRSRTLKRMNDLENQCGNSRQLFYPDLVHDYYPNRPSELDTLSLMCFAEQYEKIFYTPKTVPLICINDTNGKVIGTFKKRSKFPVIYHHKYSVQKDPELFFYSLLSLHKPWRNESDIIGNSKTYEEEFFVVLNDIPALKEAYSHKEQVRVLRDKVDTAVDTVVRI